MRRRWWTGLALAVGLLAARPAQAWDPSTTHLGMLERSVLDSAMHLRWMESSALQRGLFTPLRLDPARLPAGTRRMITLAMRQAHAASGAKAMGGPGACPGASAPESTRAHCIEGDLWEMTALGWLELGVIVETLPAERLLHHFVDRDDPSASRWTDDDLPRSVLRNKHAKAGGTVASRVTGGGFEGSGRSAIAWLDDDGDPWAPPALAGHLHRASLATDRAERDHHLALALMCSGALLHVVQDLSVPAHARGDVSALFLPLSGIHGDRGLPLQEFARDAYGRGGLPTPLALSPRPTGTTDAGTPRAPTLRGHLLGHGDWPGLVRRAGQHFFSESTLPAARPIASTLSAEDAATAVLEGVVLDETERTGAHLAPWPADRGYLIGGSGRPLAAFRIDDEGRLRTWLDRRIYRLQSQALVPLAVDTGRSVLDLVWAAWPEMTVDRPTRTVQLTPSETWAGATLLIMVEDGQGDREAIAEVAMQGPATHRVVEAWPTDLADDAQVVLVLRNPAGTLPAIVETLVDRREATAATPATPRGVIPAARRGGTGTRSTGARPPMRTGGPAARSTEGTDPETPEPEPEPEPETATPTEAAPIENETDDGTAPTDDSSR